MKFTAIALSTLLSGYAKAGSGFWNGHGTPDGLVPGVDEGFNLCDKYEGQARALCSRYCYSQDCYSPATAIVPSAVCDTVYAKLVELTGEEPLCAKDCPCFDAAFFKDYVGASYCESFAPNSLFVKDSALIDDLASSFIAVANNGTDFRRCSLVVGDIANGDFKLINAALNQTQADTCLAILQNSECQPFED